MTDLVKQAEFALDCNQVMDEIDPRNILDLQEEIERLRKDVKIEWDCGVAFGKKQVLDDMRAWNPTTRGGRAMWKHFLEAYEKDRMND